MPFLNRIRLPLYLKTPQFPTEENRFRLSNGATKTLSVTVRKVYNAQTDYLSETMHQKLVIALSHDTVNIEGDRYLGGVAKDGDYEITWPDFLDYPLGQAAVKLQVTPFDVTNSNCQTCDTMTQLSLVDDEAGVFTDGEEKVINVYANDNICCYPPSAEIVYINTAYMASVTIDETTGNVTMTALTPVPTVGNIVMATYRVTCPDGSYDEADIYGSINGSEPECEQPSGFEPFSIPLDPPFTITIPWTDPASPPAGGYEWVLYEAADPGTPIDSGTVAINEVTFTAPAAGTNYIFSVRSVCSEGVYSSYTNIPFATTDSGDPSCGSFDVTCNDGTVEYNIYSYTFMQCDGTLRTRYITNLGTIAECMLVDGSNNPVYFATAEPGITYNNTGTC